MQMSRRLKSLEAYQRGIIRERERFPERQIRLKQRVFDTFDQLLRHRGLPGFVSGTKVVDLGSADGALVRICEARGLIAYGLDVSDGLDFETDRLPIEDSSVDVVTAVSIIEHMQSTTNLLHEVKRILRPGGAIIIVTPNWFYSAREFYDDPTHIHPYTPTSLRKTLEFHDFVDAYVVPWIVKKPSWMWDLPYAFFVSRWLIPFRADTMSILPNCVKGRSGSILALARRSMT